MSATLHEIAAVAPGVLSVVGPDVTVSDLTHSSQDVAPGAAFVAIRGERFDAHRFIDDAVAAGASALIVQEPTEMPVPHIVVEDSRHAMAHMARAVHGYPDRSMSMLGITGTNGKTTVAHMCEAVWTAAGRPSGVIGTLGARYLGTPVPLNRTTPESSDLQRLLGAMRDDGVESVAMEVSSHALDLHRADAIVFTSAGFTNLSQDHLDFHGTMEEYFASKAKLFAGDRTKSAVINLDDAYGPRLAAEVDVPVLTVSMQGSTHTVPVDIVASDVVASDAGTSFTLGTPAGDGTVELPLVGSFNVSNALVAAGLLLEDGVDAAHIFEGLSSLPTISGRMEIVPGDHPFTVVVDYAHTPDAITAVLAAARAVTRAGLIVVVGAGGDRDQDKRSLMGAAAARFSDLTIVTTDNPRSEDPAAIAAEVARGAEAARRSKVLTVLDRGEAIETAIGTAEAGDVVMVLGRGHERGQEIAGAVVPFDDVDVATRAVRRVDNG
ncbi:MAG: UDP-N-acetylmuramoyl-L-alanyl-D-glutamate--2,6-diaminopimelate ligase [Acidimicrobiia bacterium]